MATSGGGTKTQPKTGTGKGGANVSLVHLAQELEASGSTGESIAAEEKIRAVLAAAASAMHHTSQAKFVKIRKSGKWYLLGLDAAREARRQRKLLDQAAQYLDHASDCLAAVKLRDQQILDRARQAAGKPSAYDPTK
jgi:hypothetical protein